MESPTPVSFVLYKTTEPNTFLIDREEGGKSVRVCTTSSHAIGSHLLDILIQGEEYAQHANGNVPWDS